MAKSHAPSISDVKRIQTHRLLETLNSMRAQEKADVTLMCGNKEFPAHKLILEANSSYFQGMFQSGMVESSSGKVAFKDLSPETLEVVLDFMYLGEVSKINCQDTVLNVLEASNMMQLDNLFHYCCNRLMDFLSRDNFHDIWKVAEVYSRQDIYMHVLCFVIMNIDLIIHEDEFLRLSVNKVKDLLMIANRNPEVIDKVLLGLVIWLCHDLEARGQHAGKLLAHVNPDSVDRKFFKLITEQEDDLPSEIINKMEALSLMSGAYNPAVSLLTTPIDDCSGVKLVYFSEYRVERSFDPLSKCYVNSKTLDSCVQLLDLCTMTWLPPQKLPSVDLNGTAMCQHDGKIYIVGGQLKSFYMIYDVATNSVEYVGCKEFDGKANGILHSVGDQLYFVERNTEGGLCRVIIINPGEGRVLQKSQTNDWNSGTAVASKNFLYIYYTGMEESVKFSCRFSIVSDQLQEGLTKIHNIPNNVPAFFLVYENCRYGFYQANGNIVRLKYDARADHWTTKVFPNGIPTLKEVTTVNRSSENLQSLVFVTTGSNPCEMPDYILHPETGKCAKLPPPTGQCCIPDDERVHKVYIADTCCMF